MYYSGKFHVLHYYIQPKPIYCQVVMCESAMSYYDNIEGSIIVELLIN
jgi:hypothetical protein